MLYEYVVHDVFSLSRMVGSPQPYGAMPSILVMKEQHLAHLLTVVKKWYGDRHQIVKRSP
nr:hypothetical protein [Prevotella sp.]